MKKYTEVVSQVDNDEEKCISGKTQVKDNGTKIEKQKRRIKCDNCINRRKKNRNEMKRRNKRKEQKMMRKR